MSARIWAWVALLAALAAGGSLVALALRNLIALPVAVGALALASASGWIWLTRRGRARVAGLVGVGLALVGGTIGLVLLGSIDELLALVALLAVFAFAAKQAHAAARPAAPAPRRSSRRRTTSAAVLFMNPNSGSGKVRIFDLPEEARRRGIEPIVLQPGDDLHELAVEAAASAEVIGMAGGDGSQALVAQVAMEHDVAYVCVPAGTRNHLALDLGLDRDDVVGALDGYTDGIDRMIDLGFVNDRVFANNVSLGVYAEIVQSDAYRDAKRETVTHMLPDLLGPRATPFDLRFTGPDGKPRTTVQMLLVSNNPYVLGRLSEAGTRPRLDTGELGIVAIEIRGATGAAELVALEVIGQVSHFPGWLEWSASEFEVRSGARVATGIDGEAIWLDPPLRFRIVPGALRVRLPPAAADRSLPGSQLSDLWHVATGRA